MLTGAGSALVWSAFACHFQVESLARKRCPLATELLRPCSLAQFNQKAHGCRPAVAALMWIDFAGLSGGAKWAGYQWQDGERGWWGSCGL